jgi:hypothetical protein
LLAGTWKEQVLFRVFLFLLLGVFILAALALALVLPGSGSAEDPRRAMLVFESILALTWVPLAGGLETIYCAVLYSYAITGMSPAEFDGPAEAPAKAGVS